MACPGLSQCRAAAENEAGAVPVPGEVKVSLGEAVTKTGGTKHKNKGTVCTKGPVSGLRDQGAQAGIFQLLPARPQGHVN